MPATLSYDQLNDMTDAELEAVANSGCKYCCCDRARVRFVRDFRCEQKARRGVEVGDTIEFVRHGTAPSGGKSRNHRDGFSEDGVSVYLLDGQEVVYVGWHFGLREKPAYRGRGLVLAWGSDGEPLVEILSIRRDETFDC